MGVLLCHLLELRHGVNGLKEIGKALTALLPAHGDQLTVALPAIMEMIANPAKLHEHYESAIIELAAIDPLLAFHLRSKNLVQSLSPFSKLALQDPLAIPYAAQAFRMFGEIGTTVLDEAILRVAKELGRGVHQKTQKTLEKNQELPEEVKPILAALPGALQAAQGAQAQVAEAPKSPSQTTTASSATASRPSTT